MNDEAVLFNLAKVMTELAFVRLRTMPSADEQLEAALAVLQDLHTEFAARVFGNA